MRRLITDVRKAEAGYQIAALDMNGNATNTAQAAAPKLLLVIGGEDKSVGQFILNMADHDIIGIPHWPGELG